MMLLLRPIFLNWLTVVSLVSPTKRPNHNQIAFDKICNNLLQCLINFLLVFKITPEIDVRCLPF